MTNREIALEFVKRFCDGDVEGLASLLSEDLHVTGPLYEFTTREEYIGTLRSDPPERAGYRVLSVSESGDEVAVFYRYEKTGMGLTIAQLFRMRNRTVYDILLVFDGRAVERR